MTMPTAQNNYTLYTADDKSYTTTTTEDQLHAARVQQTLSFRLFIRQLRQAGSHPHSTYYSVTTKHYRQQYIKQLLDQLRLI